MGCGCENTESFSFGSPGATPSSSGIIQLKSIDYGNHVPYLDQDLQEERLNICRGCEKYTKLLNKDRCTVGNGAFLKAKVSLKDQQCPHPNGSKW